MAGRRSAKRSPRIGTHGKNLCQEVATGILPILNLIDPALIENVPRTPQLGLVDRCRKAWGWFQEFVKEAGEYTAHMC